MPAIPLVAASSEHPLSSHTAVNLDTRTVRRRCGSMGRIRICRPLFFLAPWLFVASAHAAGALADKVWNHGAANCSAPSARVNPPIEVFEVETDTYVLRQNKCTHFEAPFIYVLFGQHSVFVHDTGATADPEQFPLYDEVQRLMGQRGSPALKILVAHSHSHGDHTAADAQFRGKAGVTLIEPNGEAIRKHFGLKDWPQGVAVVDLGGRTLTVIPAPGHQDEGIAIHDSQTAWLLTGDSLYPGRLYVKDWKDYRASIERLVQFSKTRPISAVLGSHIEMSRTGEVFPVGSTEQPNEASLALTVEDLLDLSERLQRAGEKPKEIMTAKFVVTPVGVLQRVIGSVLKGLGVR